MTEISNKHARNFWNTFILQREINKDFYNLIPENKFEFRMVETTNRKSDSPKESLLHQIAITRNYIDAVKTGTLEFNSEKYISKDELSHLSKKDLLSLFSDSENDLYAILSLKDIGERKVKTPWSKKPISAITTLYGLSSHEVLHIGWNLALMDHLNIPRFDRLIQMWG